jgi:hypothetical protein
VVTTGEVCDLGSEIVYTVKLGMSPSPSTIIATTKDTSVVASDL